jgi:hypothetical protein
MAGRGPAPKPAAVRARRNKKSTKTKLSSDRKARAPELTATIDWHPLARAEWRRIWASPMAQEFGDVERDGLLKLVILVNDFYAAETPRERKELASEIRLQRADFGLTPRARAGLQWEIERADEAKARNERRRPSKHAAAPKTPAPDPRGALRVVEGGRA